MKRLRIKTSLAVAALLTAGAAAWAQSNGVPGPEDYAAFSRFITDRNIFDPSRQPHYTPAGQRRTVRTTRARAVTPGIQLVGIMSYEKGPFAFFNSNSTENRKALKVADQIAGYTITEISGNFVQLEATNNREKFELKVGEGLRQENGKWIPAKPGEIAHLTSTAAAPGATSEENSGTTPGSSATPPSAAEPNDVLKRLMQQREKDNQ